MILMPNSSLPRGWCSVFLSLACLLLVAGFCSGTASAQQKEQKKRTATAALTNDAPPRLTRTTTRHEVRRLPYGSTITLLGAPVGSITIEAWTRPEVDITADIELHADTEEDLARLAVVNSFFIDEDPNQLRILTTGMHDKLFMRRTAKDFPKRLLGLPWKIDYHLRVPALTDLDINNGRGAFNLTGIEGSISYQAQESDAAFTMTGGALKVTILSGSVKLMIPTRSWRGVGASVQLAVGALTLELPAGFNGDVDAEILRTGQITNSYPELVARELTTQTTRSVSARSGAGGVTLSLTVGDGTINIVKAVTSDR
jgi:hypothetical protein